MEQKKQSNYSSSSRPYKRKEEREETKLSLRLGSGQEPPYVGHQRY